MCGKRPLEILTFYILVSQWTPLHRAVWFERQIDPETCQLLISFKADVNARNER